MRLLDCKQRILFCILLWGGMLLCPIAFSQKLNFKNFSSKNGLPSNEVYDVLQDENGIMWFATDRGLCRYDGYEFVHLNQNTEYPELQYRIFILRKMETFGVQQSVIGFFGLTREIIKFTRTSIMTCFIGVLRGERVCIWLLSRMVL